MLTKPQLSFITFHCTVQYLNSQRLGVTGKAVILVKLISFLQNIHRQSLDVSWQKLYTSFVMNAKCNAQFALPIKSVPDSVEAAFRGAESAVRLELQFWQSLMQSGLVLGTWWKLQKKKKILMLLFDKSSLAVNSLHFTGERSRW